MRVNLGKIIFVVLWFILLAGITGIIYVIFTRNVFVPYSKEKNTLTSINADISALQQPLSAVPIEQHKQNQLEVTTDLKAIDDALAKNDTAAARKSLLDLKNALYNMRDPFKAVSPTKEMIAAHDPKNKYLQQFDIDPALMKQYLSVIDMLVRIDRLKNEY